MRKKQWKNDDKMEKKSKIKRTKNDDKNGEKKSKKKMEINQ